MRIALWDIELFRASKDRYAGLGWDVRFVSPADSGRAVLGGDVDVALVPSIEVLKSTATFTVLPGVAFASKRRFPYLRLRIDRPINDVQTVLCSTDTEPFYGLASVVLREQYELVTKLVRQGEADCSLVFTDPTPDADADHWLDIGLEWFELTGTPLTWGFFVVKPGTIADSKLTGMQAALASLLRAGHGLSEDEWQGEGGPSPNLRAAYDPEVSEGIDDLAHYLFYVGILDDIPALRLMATQDG